MKWCFFRMMVNFVSLTLDLKMMEVMMIRRKSARKQRKSGTFDPSGFLEKPSMNATERQGLNLDHTPDNKTNLNESMQDFPKQHVRKIERIEGRDRTHNSPTSADNHDLLGLPVQSTNSTSEG